MLLYLLKVTSICILRDPNCHLWIQKGWNYTHFGYSFFSNFTYMYIQMKKCVLYICIHVKGPGLSPFWVCAVWCLIHIKERGLLVTLTLIKHCPRFIHIKKKAWFPPISSTGIFCSLSVFFPCLLRLRYLFQSVHNWCYDSG